MSSAVCDFFVGFFCSKLGQAADMNQTIDYAMALYYDLIRSVTLLFFAKSLCITCLANMFLSKILIIHIFKRP